MTSRSPARRRLIPSFSLACILALFASGAEVGAAEDGAKPPGIGLTNVRAGADGVTIGLLPRDTVIAGRPCRKGWVHLHPNGALAAFTAAQMFELPRLRVPEGTWVKQDSAGAVVLCAFPRDTEIQGYPCRGTGGPKGVQVAFYASGAIKQFYPARKLRIDGVSCDTGLIRGSIVLYENGRLQECLLAEDFTQAGRVYRKGQRLHLGPDGEVVSR